jgi:hypothetical protein
LNSHENFPHFLFILFEGNDVFWEKTIKLKYYLDGQNGNAKPKETLAFFVMFIENCGTKFFGKQSQREGIEQKMGKNCWAGDSPSKDLIKIWGKTKDRFI